MKREDLEKLLGRFASDTLSEAERKALFEAALQDQELFDALAREDALREVFEDPQSRRSIVAALEAEPLPAWRRALEWFARPQAWGLAGGLAATVALAVLMVSIRTQPKQLVQLAKRQELPAAAAPVVAPAEPPVAAAETQREKRRSFAAPRAAERAAESRDLPPPPPLLVAERVPAVEPPAAVSSTAAPAPQVRATLADSALEFRAGAKQERLAATGRVLAQLTPQQLYEQGNLTGAVEPMQFAPAQQAGERAETRSRAAANLAARPVGLLPRALGLRYTIEQKRADDAYTEATASTLRPGEPVRLNIEANVAGYVYVFAGDRQLFSGPVQPWRPYLVDVPDGQAAVRIVLARQAQIAPRQLLATPPAQLAESAGRVMYLVNTSPQPEAVVVTEVALAPR